MKVIDQLVFMGQLHGLDAATANARGRQWAERLEIAEGLDKKTEELSKGMQQKIQFIATLLHDPDLIIMDEPFSGLDPVNAILLQDTLIELKNQGKAILFSTHRMDQVEKLCDAISLVNRGTVVLSGTMREVKSRYERNRVVIEFEGDDSFLKHESVAEFKNYAGHAEVKLKDHADAQELLRAAIDKARRSTNSSWSSHRSKRYSSRPWGRSGRCMRRCFDCETRVPGTGASKAFLFMTIAFPALMSLAFGGSFLAARA